MAILPVLELPDPRLRAKARPVAAITSEVLRLVDDLFETLFAARALGLAAPQVGVDLRVVALDVSGRGAEPELFINPELSGRRGTAMVEESCLSVPGVVASVARAPALRVRALDRAGQVVTRELEGLPAVCLQHEVDHLDGILFIDRLPFFARRRANRALRARAGGDRIATP